MGGRLSVEKHLCFNPPTLVGGSLVQRAVFDIELLEHPPVRITIGRIGRMVGALGLLERHLDKLPKTKEYLNDKLETVEDFQVRRVHLAALRIREAGDAVVPWRIEKLAGLRPDYSKKVQMAICYEVNKIAGSTYFYNRSDDYVINDLN